MQQGLHLICQQFKINSMFKTKLLSITFSLLLFELISCNKQPYKPDTTLVAGYVIGKETCNIDESKNYWLVDLTYKPNTPQYGDTLFFNGQYYTNVVKTKELPDTVKYVGTAIDIEFKTISQDKIQTTGCNVTNPQTFDLKEIFVINIGRIR